MSVASPTAANLAFAAGSFASRAFSKGERSHAGNSTVYPRKWYRELEKMFGVLNAVELSYFNDIYEHHIAQLSQEKALPPPRIPRGIERQAKKWEGPLPKGWTDESRKKFWDSLTSRAPKHKVTECIKRMDGKLSNPGAFCASLADRVIPGWREEAAKDRAKKASPDSKANASPYFKALAKRLHDANKGKSQDDLHYRAYLRAIMNGDFTGYLVKKYKGAEKARADLIDEAGKAPKKASGDRKLMERMVLELQDFPHSTLRELHSYATSSPPSSRKPMSVSLPEVKAALDALVEMGAVVLRGSTYQAKGGRGVWNRAASQPLQTRRDYGGSSNDLLSLEEVKALCPPCADKMKKAGLKKIRVSFLEAAMLKQASFQPSFTKLRDGSWGVKILDSDYRKGATITVTTKAGKSKKVTLDKKLWSGKDRYSGGHTVALVTLKADSASSRSKPSGSSWERRREKYKRLYGWDGIEGSPSYYSSGLYDAES